ncbi:uncharacterized protein [Miscanthus floridulus]|uniref:uncharacterized protein isoform X2 n=1 Tax=Miscanthus floridulus TaxID=154761 RepID=UPI00345B4C30
MAEVLGNGDLLHEILLPLGFPTCLVRAAAVCRRWLRLASDPAFVRRFRKLHPPHPLGFYLVTYCDRPFPRFVPLPQHPELAAVIHRGSFGLGQEVVSDCSSGHLVLSLNSGFAVRRPRFNLGGAQSPFQSYCPLPYKVPTVSSLEMCSSQWAMAAVCHTLCTNIGLRKDDMFNR